MPSKPADDRPSRSRAARTGQWAFQHVPRYRVRVEISRRLEIEVDAPSVHEAAARVLRVPLEELAALAQPPRLVVRSVQDNRPSTPPKSTS